MQGELEDWKKDKKWKKIFRTFFLLGCILVTTSIGSYFFNQKVIRNQILEVF